MEHYYINTIPLNRRQTFSISKDNTYPEGISCMIHCSLATTQERSANRSVSHRLVSQQYQYKHEHAATKVFCECPFCTLIGKIFPLKSFSVCGSFSHSFLQLNDLKILLKYCRKIKIQAAVASTTKGYKLLIFCQNI